VIGFCNLKSGVPDTTDRFITNNRQIVLWGREFPICMFDLRIIVMVAVVAGNILRIIMVKK